MEVEMLSAVNTEKPARLLCLWDFPGKHTGEGCHFLLQRIFLTQRLNPGLPHCKQDALPSETLGKFQTETDEFNSDDHYIY